ncbi:MAG: hypothetical protein FJ272_12155, partial [Planctomycetes bacterium]|nr:hypothetical protein [Planctomycetota bacterium]
MRTLMMLALLSLALHAQAEPVVVDDFASPQPTGWQVSGSPEYYKGGFGAKGVSIVPNADDGKPSLRAAIHIRADAPTPACWLTKTLPSLPGLHRWERLTFRFKLTSIAGLAADKALLCRFRTGPTTFADLPFAQPAQVKVGEWQDACVRFDAFEKPVNIYINYFESLKELTFRFGAEQDKGFDGEFWVSAIRFHAKSPPDWKHEPRITPRQASGLRRALLITHSAASFYFVRETMEALGVAVDRRLFRGLHFPVFGFPGGTTELFNSEMIALVDVDPYVLTRGQVELLCDYVASGGGLLFVAGPNTLGMAKSFPRPLAEMLPVTFEEGRPLIAVNAAPRLAAAHPVTSGLGSELKLITKAHALKPKAEAVVLLNAGPRTPAGWGLYSGGGRDDGVLLLSEDAHSGRHSAMLETKKFHVDPKTGKPSFIGLKLMQGDSDGYVGSRAYPAKPSTAYRFAFWLKGDAPQVKVSVTGWKTDEAKPDDREHLDTSLAPLKPTSAWQRH